MRGLLRMLQHVVIVAIAAFITIVMILWSTRAVSPWWPAFVFAVARVALSYFTGATTPTVVGTFFAALFLGVAFFWLLQRTQGRWVWWLIVAAGVALLSL